MGIKGYKGLVIITGSILLIVLNFGIYVWIYENSHNSKYNYNVGDTVLVNTSKFGRGTHNVYNECDIVEIINKAIKIKQYDSLYDKGYWEEWIDKNLIVEVLKKEKIKNEK